MAKQPEKQKPAEGDPERGDAILKRESTDQTQAS